MRLVTLLSFILLSLVATPAYAQLNIPGTTGNQVQPEIRLDPQFPQPNESVEATIVNAGSDTFGATITWTVDGLEVLETKNSKSISFVANDRGETQKITAVINKSNGGREVINENVKPFFVDIIVEPQTHVPSFYLGRPLPSTGSLVNLTALLSSNISTDRLVYTWRIGRVVLGGGPIRGHNSVSFEAPMGRNLLISLNVSDIYGEAVAEKYIIIPSVSPHIRFYETNALFGININPIDKTLSLISNSTVVRAEPYNLDSRVYNSPTIIEWEVSGQSYSNSGSNPYEVTLQRTGVSGSSRLDFHVRDTRQLLQGARGSISLNL
jgi:hypothetical protein